MRNIPAVFRTAILALALGSLTVGLAAADDHFALAVGSHDTLIIFGPKGERVAQLPVPSISAPVTVGATSFQVSYGRDANNLLTAILAPNPAQPQDLHFNVLNKSVDANSQAVVTLTFSPSLGHVSVDPGYVGTVAVNSSTVHHRDIADAEMPADSNMPHMPVRRTTSSEVTSNDMPMSPPPQQPSAPIETPAPVDSSALASAPPPARVTALAQTGAGAPEPGLPSTASDEPTSSGTVLPAPQFAPTPHTNDAAQSGSGPVASDSSGRTLYWSEPITPPDGPPPTVGFNQMKLLEVSGPVTVDLPNGSSETATEGALIPSGSIVKTEDDGSAAVFMGGVNSTRLLPNSEARVTQTMSGSTRHTNIDLHDGTIFSRVGHREGEKQDFEVRTEEGVAAARGTILVNGKVGRYSYLGVGMGTVNAAFVGEESQDVTSDGTTPSVVGSPGAPNPGQFLVDALLAAQPFNVKLNAILADVASGHATPRERAFVRDLIHVESTSNVAVYDPDHPLGFLQPVSSFTGYGDGVHTTLSRPQDYQYPNPFLRFGPNAIPQNLQPFNSAPLSPH